MAVFQILKSFFLHFSEKTKQCALCFRVLVHEITRTQKYSFHMVWGSKIYYTPAKQINYTWKKQQYNLWCFLKYVFPYTNIYLFFYDFHFSWSELRGYIPKTSISLEIEKNTEVLILTLFVLSFLKYWPLRLTFSIFLASLFSVNYSIIFLTSQEETFQNW